MVAAIAALMSAGTVIVVGDGGIRGVLTNCDCSVADLWTGLTLLLGSDGQLLLT